MRVSVVVCTYSIDLYGYLQEAVESLLEQTYDDVEIVVISDGNEELRDRVEDEYGGYDKVVVALNEDDSEDAADSRNQSRMLGARTATGDVVAFMDDDAVAEPDWVDELVRTYREHDAIAVGGKLVPLWEGDEPDFFPEEFYWLIGATHRGFAPEDEVTEVRNTFASNISFLRGVFLSLGGFDSSAWSESNIQGEEAELCLRMADEYGEGVMYNPDAVVGHTVPEDRTCLTWLSKRSFWQGYWKRAMERRDLSSDEEFGFLATLLLRYLPGRMWRAVSTPSTTEAKKAGAILLFTFLVGLGYLYAFLARP